MASDSDTLRFVTPRGRLLVLAGLCAVITAMGVVIIALNVENTPSLLLGVAVVGIFGLGGGFSLIGQFRAATVLRAVEDERPRPLYAVGSNAPFVFALRRLLPRAAVLRIVARRHGLG